MGLRQSSAEKLTCVIGAQLELGLWMITWMAMASSRDRLREGARGPQWPNRKGPGRLRGKVARWYQTDGPEYPTNGYLPTAIVT